MHDLLTLRLPVNKGPLYASYLSKAIGDGVIKQTKQNELCGLVAYLKTGYLCHFHKIMVVSITMLLIIAENRVSNEIFSNSVVNSKIAPLPALQNW